MALSSGYMIAFHSDNTNQMDLLNRIESGFLIAGDFWRTFDQIIILKMQQELPKRTTTQEDFYIMGRRCNLKSSYSVLNKPKEDLEKNEVISFLSIGEADHIHKVFKMKLGNILSICLENTKHSPDSVPINSSNNQQEAPNEQEDKGRNKKLVLFKDNIFSNSFEERGKGDKKNIVKNVVNAFLRYLKKFKDQGRYVDQHLTLLNTLIEQIRYNNQLILSIVKEESLREVFKLFLSVQAGNWLDQSKIRNKKIYQEALRIYQRLCDREEGFEEAQPQQNNEKNSPPQQKNSSNNSLSFFQDLGNHDLEDEIMKFK